ncbi:hypothetical protein B0J14DRAFT_45092 [Halenospora varia]|nr:hypothetical protein B0J14DRAFT_45092 [Halenospora varia]
MPCAAAREQITQNLLGEQCWVLVGPSVAPVVLATVVGGFPVHPHPLKLLPLLPRILLIILVVRKATLLLKLFFKSSVSVCSIVNFTTVVKALFCSSRITVTA